MPIDRRHFLSSSVALALGAATLPGVLFAQSAAAAPYERLPRPLPKEGAGKIAVLEFFSYGCAHCNDFHPIISKWAARQPAHVVFRRIPVAWDAFWANLARLYYALEISGELASLDNKVFDALHKQRLKLYTEKTILDWYAKQGGNRERFGEIMKSFSVVSKINQGEKLRLSAEVKSVPTVIVDGAYKMLGATYEGLLENTDRLIARIKGQEKS
ncbi:MAG: thiol:disulfide interchange protein DsbA/DsbL [Zoogloeaceae bacterium]|jgi:thiol:disulfide interchange protein DsbA|nr:thiol:disulfide interchange protein DsbA/DsbL [Zoogloeaceae bacterium]